ncbi:polyprenol reductase-like [Branchiostoma lanceolatum]|uniref:polyprenol reductase-like n=1 Tax=Branchiostoma lanceolatum TaxID=7740 RepID=UPI003454FFD1
MDSCLLEVFWFSLISAFLLGWTVYTLFPTAPDFLQDLLHYGKCKVVRDDRSWLRVFDIPKRWFSHFYYEGVVWNSFILLVALLSFVGGVPAFWWLQEGLSFISNYPLDPPTADHVSVLLALILLEFQMIRRLWECLYVSIFSDVSVHLVHYLLGMIYYLAVPISIIAEGPKLDGTRLSLSDVRWSHVIGTGLFIWSFWQQNKAHIILANLRKDKRGYVVTRGHKIPYGGWFEYVSNPHYLAELLMYLSIIIVLGGEHYLSWVIQGYILVELGLCGWITHNWYRTKFDNYPSSRSILIPYIF